MQNFSRAVFVSLLAGCGGSSSTAVDSGVGSSDANPDFSESNGKIVVRTFLNEQVIQLSGRFNDGPALQFAVESERIGFCKLMTYSPSLCDPSCTNSDVCIAGECKAFPGQENRGPLEWSWPGGAMTVEPDALNSYYGSATFTTHGEVSVVIEGTTLRVMTGDNPSPSSDWGMTISNRGQTDAVLQWDTAVDGARVKLRMIDCIGSHGGVSASEIVCEAPDSGQLTIPASFLDALDDGDWSHGECGSHELIRYRSDASADGKFRLESHEVSGFFYRP